MKENKWKDLISCIGLVKYGMSVKQCFCTMTLFMVIGIAFEMMTLLWTNGILMNRVLDFGALFMFSAVVYPVQMLITLDITGMVQASPYKKRIQTSAMSLISLWGNLVVLVILLLIRGLGAWLVPERAAVIWNTLPTVGILGLGLSVMIALAYKFYIVSVIVMILVFGASGGFNGIYRIGEMETPGMTDGLSPAAAIGFCVIMIFLGNALQYVINRVIYKRPFSKWAFGSALGKKFV